MVSDLRRIRAWSRRPGCPSTADSASATRWPVRSTTVLLPLRLTRLNPLGLNNAAAALVQPRHRRAAPAVPAADRAQRGEVVPAVQRTGRGFRPGVAGDQGGARRRRLGDLRPEGVDHVGRRGRLRGPARPYRSRASPSSQGITLLPARHAPARCRGAPAAPDHRRSASSTRCSSTARACPTRTGSARSTTAGGSAHRRCRVSGRWCRARAPAVWADSVARAPSA